jgi:hypothetical protein
MKYHRLFALAVAPMVLIGCDDDDTPSGTQQFAKIRVINASPSTATVTASVGSLNLGTVAFRSGGAGCFQVPVGSQTITFTSGGSTIATAGPIDFQTGPSSTFVLFGTAAARTVSVFPDNFAAAATGMNQLRFINAQTAAGDIFVTTPTGTVSGTPSASVAAGAVSTGGSVGFLPFPTANTRIRLFDAGTTTAPRTDATLGTLPTSRTTTMVFVEAGNPPGATAFTVDPCP